MPILNRQLLSRLVREGLGRFPTQSAATRATGLSQTGLSRLLNGKQGELEIGNFINLHRLVPEPQHTMLDRCFVPRGARVLGRRYTEWLHRAAGLFSVGVGDRLVRTQWGFEVRPFNLHEGAETPRDYERKVLWRYMRFRSPGLVRAGELIFKKLPNDVLARARIIDPLINAAESGFQEVSWRELRLRDYSTLHDIVELGIKRERLLLPKKTGLERLVEVFRLSDLDFVRHFGRRAVSKSLFRRRPSRSSQ